MILERVFYIHLLHAKLASAKQLLDKFSLPNPVNLDELFNVPGETGKDTAKMGGNSASFSTGVHSTFKHLPTSSRFGQYTLYFTNSRSLELAKG